MSKKEEIDEELESPVYKRIQVEIEGLSPLLMNRLNPESLRAKSRMKTQDYSTKTDAANSAYMDVIDGKKQLYIPMEAVYSMIVHTAKQYRIRRTSLTSILAGNMRVEPAKISLGTDTYEIDERAVVIQNQRVLKGRAKLFPWAAKFYLVYDANRLPEGIDKTLKTIIADAGTRMGLLDFRPQHMGWFGTFRIKHFTILDGEQTEKETATTTVKKPRKARVQ